MSILSPNNTPGLGAQQLDINNNINAPGASVDYAEAYQNRVVIAPLGVAQIGAFAFDYHALDQVTMENDVTDHWVETNTAVQDQIAVRPNVITVRGYISELALQGTIAAILNATLASVETSLSQAPAYLGKYSPGTTQTLFAAITQIQSVAVQIEQAAARAFQIASFFLPGPSMNKQQAAFAQLSALRNARILFTVYTPFQVFWNMAIINIQAIQGPKTVTMSDFSVTMKQLQFTSNVSPNEYTSLYGGNAAYGSQAQTSNGVTAGTPSPLNNVVSSFQSAGSTAGALL